MPELEKTEILIKKLYDRILPLFPNEKMDVILFGSYARGDYEEGSDIDVMFLVNTSRNEIAQKNWQIGNIAGDLLIEYGILISPIVENRKWFRNNANIIPLFKNILREGTYVNV